MSIIRSIRTNYSYAVGLGRFLRGPIDPERARQEIEQKLTRRNESFLRILEQAIYKRPSNPYYKLLEHARIGFEDVRKLVDEHGLEEALGRLYDAGVYVTHDEMKGRQPIKRGRLELATDAADFDSPFMEPVMQSQTSGSTGQPTRALFDFQNLERRAVFYLFSRNALSEERPMAIWDVGKLEPPLGLAKAGSPVEKHFSTNAFRWTAEGLRSAVFSNYTLLAARLYGRPTPRPRFASRENPLPVVRWLAEKTAAGTPAMLKAPASLATRGCLFAREHGFDISGTLFHLHGEPFTPGKAEVLKSVGTEARVSYGMVEGTVGAPCGAPTELDEVHLMADCFAVIQRDKVTTSGATVPGLVLTGLTPDLKKLSLNFESGDYANVSHRDCGCFFEKVGYGTHLSGIRSYEKLTSEGMTFMGSRLYELVEEVLPARYGGGPGDYQLVEEEEEGLPRVSVVVSPRVGAVDETAVMETALKNIEASHPQGGELMTAQWRQAQTLRVVRRDPFETRTQKVPPLHVIHARSSARAPKESEATAAAGPGHR